MVPGPGGPGLQPGGAGRPRLQPTALAGGAARRPGPCIRYFTMLPYSEHPVLRTRVGSPRARGFLIPGAPSPGGILMLLSYFKILLADNLSSQTKKGNPKLN